MISGCCASQARTVVRRSANHVASRNDACASGQNRCAASTQCRKYARQGSTSSRQTLAMPRDVYLRCHSSGRQRRARYASSVLRVQST